MIADNDFKEVVMEITLDQAYKLFMADRETSCVPKTLIYYRENLSSFITYCSECFGRPSSDILCSEITKELFSNYIKYLRKRPKFYSHPFLDPLDETLSSSSINTYARSIKVFASFCKENEFGVNFTHKVKLPRNESAEIIPLYASEVKAIDACFNIKTELGLRNWCIVHLMLDAGFRCSEVINLRFCDLIFDKNIIRVYKSKFSKTRLVILCPRLKANLVKYCILYRNYTVLHEKDFVFMQMKNEKPINDNTVKQFFARIKKKSGVTRLHPHLCRHTFATSYIMGGGNMEMLRLLLGHSDYDVTRNYLHLAQQFTMLGADIYRLDPVFFKNYTV